MAPAVWLPVLTSASPPHPQAAHRRDMPYLQLDGQQVPLASGDTLVGAGADGRIRLDGTEIDRVLAVIRVGTDASAVVLRGGADSLVRMNGVTLGAEPSPLIHGDKIDVGGRELVYGDDRKAGSTQFVPTVKLPEPTRATQGESKPTAATGGRLVSLVDGREYSVPEGGLVIGRDPSCDVVVPSTDASRKHALIAPGPHGYVLTDMSANGMSVNGNVVQSAVSLARGAVLKVANEEFRFYADIAPDPEVAPARDGAPVVRPLLATLEVVNDGALKKGQRFDIRTPLTHVGRGEHNDVVIPDESVSDTHAKLQRREDGWVLVDMGSTNGTYVGGRRLTGEQRLVGAPDLRFGGVKLVFRVTPEPDDVGDAPGATRAIVTARVPARDAAAAAVPPVREAALAPTMASRRPPRPAAPTTRADSPSSSRAVPVAVTLAALLLAGAGVYLFMKGR